MVQPARPLVEYQQIYGYAFITNATGGNKLQKHRNKNTTAEIQACKLALRVQRINSPIRNVITTMYL